MDDVSIIVEPEETRDDLLARAAQAERRAEALQEKLFKLEAKRKRYIQRLGELSAEAYSARRRATEMVADCK